MQRQIIISVTLIVSILLVGAGGLGLLIKFERQPLMSTPDRPALLVQAVRLAAETTIEPILGYGSAKADRYTNVSSEVAGRIIDLAAKLRVGEHVEVGEVLVRIDEREYASRRERAQGLLSAVDAGLARLDIEERNLDKLIAIAESELDIAAREHQRVLDLFEHDQGNRRELDVAKSAYEAARRRLRTLENDKDLIPQRRAIEAANRAQRAADLALAELDLERCRVLAPFSGRLESVDVDLGEHVSVGSVLVSVIDPDRIEVAIELPISLRTRVRVGSPCTLQLESDTTSGWSARVSRIAPSADEQTRTFALFIDVDNTTQKQPIVPGAFVRARIDGPRFEDVIVVPRGIVQRGHVYVYNDGVAKRREVEVRQHLLDRSIVRGLSPGEILITSNLDVLYDGAAVRVRLRDGRADVARDGKPAPKPADGT